MGTLSAAIWRGSPAIMSGVRLLEELRGQNAAVATLQRAVHSAQLAHAYLFDGPSGVGKQRAAIAVALARLCPEKPGKGCGRCRVCARIVEGNHPDVRIFGPREDGDRNLKIETLREEILPIARGAPFESPACFLIFPEADISFPPQHMEAANALLKPLEEPRPGVCFVMLAERPDRLLSTIRSRCQRVRFRPLPDPVVERILAQEGVAADDRPMATRMAEGRADHALFLARDGHATELIERALKLHGRLQSGTPGDLVDTAETLAKDEHLDALLQMLVTIYRDIAALGLGQPFHSLRCESSGRALAELAQDCAPGEAARRVEAVLSLREQIGRNARPELALNSLLFDIRGRATGREAKD